MRNIKLILDVTPQKWACLEEIHPADSAEWRVKQCNISPAAARHWLSSAITFLGNRLWNQKT
jgi:hypothetical protein